MDVDEVDLPDDDDDEEEREKNFFGHEEYTIMSSVPEEAEEKEDIMSQTMQQRENKVKQDRVNSLRKEIMQLKSKIAMQKELGEHLAGKSVIF